MVIRREEEKEEGRREKASGMKEKKREIKVETSFIFVF